MNTTSHHKVLIVGGGTAGITVAARLARQIPARDIAIVEPSSKHHYQPMWTLVGGGIFKKERSERDEAGLIPRGAQWVRDAVTTFEPETKRVLTRDGRTLTYDWLIVAPGIQVNWSKIPGLKESLGTKSVCSNYSYEHVDYTWETLRKLQRGTALFTHPAGAIKCGGAPQKIMYLAEDWLRREGLRDQTEVIFTTALPTLFAVEKYRKTLEKHVADRGIEANFRLNLIELRPDAKEAVFENLDTKEQRVIRYDMIHVTPPMGPPDFVKASALVAARGDDGAGGRRSAMRLSSRPNSSQANVGHGGAIRRPCPSFPPANPLQCLIRGCADGLEVACAREL